MNIELMTLEARVGRFAALADPMRLRIVDLLTIGDVSPSELQSQLDISSSLLAHHIGVLERSGFLIRSRSDADRRRTYLRLTENALEDLVPAPRLAARRVVFVCTGNSARSQLAAAMWQAASTVPATSAGTHPAARIEPGAIATARRHDLALAASKPRNLQDVVDVDDLIITVCDTAHEEVGGLAQLHWSIPDPVRDGTDAAFDAAFDDIADRVAALAPHIESTSTKEQR
ncbi:helix-turn-helix domain-containing protein [Microbacterium sp. CJ88]|uniref:arsenate reductase/protein-tyrosine-phosphatase family protein n=1 Tax=Microbacterium sp. CJ88 TaxID=3445672 RepID=UPI003F65C5AE